MFSPPPPLAEAYALLESARASIRQGMAYSASCVMFGGEVGGGRLGADDESTATSHWLAALGKLDRLDEALHRIERDAAQGVLNCRPVVELKQLEHMLDGDES